MRYSHDPLGRRDYSGPSSEPSQTTYGWQGERLTTQSGAGWSANHVYDATGQRTRSVVTSGSLQTATTWAYEGIRLTGLDAVRSDTATWSLEYLYDEKGTITGGIYSAEDTSCAFLVVATDRGDVRELLDANGDAFAFYSCDAYGNPDETLSRGTALVPAGLAANISQRNVLRYAGYCYDEVSGLYYLSQRYYDPASACFVSKDPARADGEESAYQYCAGDPVGKVDPTGLGYRDVWVQNWNSLNSAEKALAKSWRATQLLSYYNASKAALKRAQAKFPGWALKNDKADAFRHAYWNAALSRLIGRKSAKVWTDAHETGAVGQPWREKSMDLHNNFVGRDVSSTYWSLQMTGGRDNVEGRILSSGRLWWFGNGV